MATMIEVEGLGKRYRLGGQDKYYRTLREQMMRTITKPWQWLRGGAAEDDEFWALREVSFTVEAGEVVGLIGRNGAGKSTLLKLLGRITRPTEGRAKLYGRVGSLLEVGTGFHPELTGRENIYLSGNILGMTRREVKNKFAEIADFAEVDKFLDTPVKHYSTGMYTRLGFAIAAHLEPEILLVDEVLAVGDAQFQKKCLGKMSDVAKAGRTVLFVSHNMSAVNSLCSRCLVLNQGGLFQASDTPSAIRTYMELDQTDDNASMRWSGDDSPGNHQVRICGARVTRTDGTVAGRFDNSEEICIELDYELLRAEAPVQVGWWLHSVDGTILFVGGDRESAAWDESRQKPGFYRSCCRIPAFLLNAGLYQLSLASDTARNEINFLIRHALSFQVEFSKLPAHSHQRPDGYFCISLPWSIVPYENAGE